MLLKQIKNHISGGGSKSDALRTKKKNISTFTLTFFALF